MEAAYIVWYSRKLAGAELRFPCLLPWRVERNVQCVTKQKVFTENSCHPASLRKPQAERKWRRQRVGAVLRKDTGLAVTVGRIGVYVGE